MNLNPEDINTPKSLQHFRVLYLSYGWRNSIEAGRCGADSAGAVEEWVGGCGGDGGGGGVSGRRVRIEG